MYYTIILEEALKELWGKSGNVLEKIFSLEAFERPISVQNKLKIVLPTDYDILTLIKSFCGESDWYKIYASHSPGHFTLWKSEAEYRSFFSNFKNNPNSDGRRTSCLSFLTNTLKIETKDIIINYPNGHFITNLRGINIDIGLDKPESFHSLVEPKVTPKEEPDDEFFYIFINNKHKKDMENIKKKLKESISAA